MAKRLGFGPDALIRAIPSPKQGWKLPVKDWVHELHFKRFGKKPPDPMPADPPAVGERSPEPWESGAPWDGDEAPSAFRPMRFAPIELRDYVRKYVQANPGADEREVTARLRQSLAAYQAGAKCQECGEPIWVIGSAESGNFCFSCATGEADSADDYEIAEACRKRTVSLCFTGSNYVLPEADPSLDEVFLDFAPDDRDVPF